MAKLAVLIDNDQDDLDFMKEALQHVDPGVLCSCFVYPDEAIGALSKGQSLPPDYIFVDINMPRKSGIECLEDLRKIKALNHVPIIVCSTSMSDKVSTQLLEQGANFTFQKPFSMGEYVVILKRIMKNCPNTIL